MVLILNMMREIENSSVKTTFIFQYNLRFNKRSKFILKQETTNRRVLIYIYKAKVKKKLKGQQVKKSI